MAKEMIDEELNKEIQALLKYVDTLEKDNHILRSDRTEQQKSRETFENHSQQVLVEIQDHTRIYERIAQALEKIASKT